MILSGQSIRNLCFKAEPLLWPWTDRLSSFGMTYGIGPAGYDVTVEFDKEGQLPELLIPPGGFVLASTIEKFTMPDNLLGTVHDKSSWARKGLAVQNTVIEPGWIGWLTLELTNHSPHSITLQKGMPIAQVIFQQLDFPSQEPYRGKYNHQDRGPIKAR